MHAVFQKNIYRMSSWEFFFGALSHKNFLSIFKRYIFYTNNKKNHKISADDCRSFDQQELLI